MKQDLSKPIPLSVKKLAKAFSFLHCGIWHGLESCITLKEVEDKLKSKTDLPNKPYTFPIWKHFEEQEFRDFHAGRIAYLVLNPASDPISVDVGIPSMGCFPSWGIDDGNHRLSAAIVRGDETILVNFSGAEPEIRAFIKRYSPRVSKRVLTKPS